MSFNDIFKSSFLENVAAVSVFDIALSLVLAFLIGLFIFLVYKKTYQGVMYSSSFGVALVALVMITTLVILAVTSNVVLSLGMVGALSLVRFRTAIKEPLDLAFLFWSIADGIVLAAGMIPLAVIGTIFIGIILLIFVNRKSSKNPYILVVSCDNIDSEEKVLAFVDENVKKSVVKSKSVRRGNTELNMEVRLKNEDATFVSGLAGIDGVTSAVLVSYNGDYMG